jgi:hypothetical protein
VEAQPTRPDVLERPRTQLRAVGLAAPIDQDDLEALPARALVAPSPRPDAAERDFDGTIAASGIRVADDVRQRFVDRQDDRPALRLGESEVLGKDPSAPRTRQRLSGLLGSSTLRSRSPRPTGLLY